MRTAILAALLFCSGLSYGSVVHIPIKSGLTLQPNQSFTLSIEATAPVEINWRTSDNKPCPTNCIEATELNRHPSTGFATSLGAGKEYTPAAGKIAIEYKNISSAPVTIDIFRVRRTCDAEACRFMPKDGKTRWLVYKIAAFKSITTSKDNSYSLISGTALSGRSFTVRAVWWTDDSKGFRFHCDTWIKRWIDSRTPPEKYSPYILSGQAIGEGNNIVLKSIDDCVPNAPHFGVPDANVFK